MDKDNSIRLLVFSNFHRPYALGFQRAVRLCMSQE